MKRILSVVFILAFLLIGFAYAEVKSPGINERQANQQERIANGIESGELTAKEATKLERGEAKIQKTKKRMKADGKLTKKERKKLNKMLNKESKKIYKEKHDSDKR